MITHDGGESKRSALPGTAVAVVTEAATEAPKAESVRGARQGTRCHGALRVQRPSPRRCRRHRRCSRRWHATVPSPAPDSETAFEGITTCVV